MSGLTAAHRIALAALIGRCPETVLKSVAAAVAALPGGRAAELRLMLAEEMRDRARRAFVLAPVARMFQRRADGIGSMSFPPAVLPRLWRAAIEREPGLLPRLDDPDGPDAAAVANRYCLSAAAAVRDRPALVWPEDLEPARREQGLFDLASCLDLAHLARRGLPSIEVWLKRPDGDQLAELRLLVKDCSDIHDDGAGRLLEMLFSQLDDAVLVLRIITRTSGVAGRRGFLSASELAGFVDRLLDGVDERSARLAAYQPGKTAGGVDTAIADLDWCAGVLAELDVTLTLDPDSEWGRRVRDSRVKVSGWLSGLLRTADKAVDKALPLTRVQTSGRMSRMAPMLDAAARGEAADAALALLRLVGATRGAAAIFGSEAARKALVDTLTERLSGYADEVLTMVNEGEAPDETHALRLVSVAARYLELIESKDAARTVRRRAAVAGGGPATSGASSRAA
ncbi:hypothetical protein [Brevundimonas sp. M20]|uniref:hypothetical protein n=1 Tax=Brevundimonas sp. M20 TaxID=2591463 RepID=UPI001146DEEF|nr:hypothetical protein [Brevundimonas sp. M20]QDH74331.1 hypothetical protein FKQ52_13435 [Brevundimonas sp. M20]